MTANTLMYSAKTRENLPANSAVEAVMIGCAAILVDITPGARVPGAKVPAAIVGKATKPAVPTMEVITVLPAIVIAGTEKKTESTCHNKDYIHMVEPSKWTWKKGNIILTTRGHVLSISLTVFFKVDTSV